MKPKRNKPCPCGSGKKYKKCCMPRDEEGVRTMDNKPQNKFRDEVEKGRVSDEEMLARDGRVGYLYIKSQVEIRAADYRHLQSQVARLKAFGNKVFLLPDCNERQPILNGSKQSIEQLEKRAEAFQPSRAQHVILSLMEEKFGEDEQPVTTVKIGDEAGEPSNLPADEPAELKDE